MLSIWHLFVLTRAQFTVLLNAGQLRSSFQKVVHRILCTVIASFLIHGDQNMHLTWFEGAENHLVFLLRYFDVFRLFGECILVLLTCLVGVIVVAP